MLSLSKHGAGFFNGLLEHCKAGNRELRNGNRQTDQQNIGRFCILHSRFSSFHSPKVRQRPALI